MSVFFIHNGTDLDKQLTEGYRVSDNSHWAQYIKSLDENIVTVKYQTFHGTMITFKDEISKMFFLLKYT